MAANRHLEKLELGKHPLPFERFLSPVPSIHRSHVEMLIVKYQRETLILRLYP